MYRARRTTDVGQNRIEVKPAWIAILVAGLLHSAASLADDTQHFDVGTESRRAETQALLADIRFQDSSTLTRLSKLRNLSILTLGQFGRSKIFVGVNRDGLVGLHFGAYSRNASERYLELARMPYLQRR